MLLLIAMALALGMVGLRASKPHAGTTVAAPAQHQAESPANPEPAKSAPQPKPANDRNG